MTTDLLQTIAALRCLNRLIVSVSSVRDKMKPSKLRDEMTAAIKEAERCRAGIRDIDGGKRTGTK